MSKLYLGVHMKWRALIGKEKYSILIQGSRVYMSLDVMCQGAQAQLKETYEKERSVWKQSKDLRINKYG